MGEIEVETLGQAQDGPCVERRLASRQSKIRLDDDLGVLQ
jgi:hypothetical protein